MWELDADRRKLLVLKRMIESLEQAVDDAKLVAMQMELHLFEEYELEKMAVLK
tara:strand:- start:1114 stop:1272 length:159 start_codon:yes stop_codon:yes gene_type:complete